jgi:hypothetical protein
VDGKGKPVSHYFKVLTHDYRPPIQGGAPIWDGKKLPHPLPAVSLDTSPAQYGAGWNCTETLAAALGQGGFWPDGRSTVAFAVEPGPDVIRRNSPRPEILRRPDTYRASTLTLVRRATDVELRAAVLEFSQPFGTLAARMAEEQWAWYIAFRRPERDPEWVEAGLRQALAARGRENWNLRQFGTGSEAWAMADP